MRLDKAITLALNLDGIAEVAQLQEILTLAAAQLALVTRPLPVETEYSCNLDSFMDQIAATIEAFKLKDLGVE